MLKRLAGSEGCQVRSAARSALRHVISRCWFDWKAFTPPMSPGKSSDMKREGWQGWDEYAPFYDWENARTLGRRDVPFWRRLARRGRGPRAGARLRHRPRLAAARARRRRRSSASIDRRRCSRARAPARAHAPARGRGAIACVSSAATSARCRSRRATFAMVIAPYGILQSLLARARSRRRRSTRSRGCSRRAASSASTSCPTCRNWREYRNRVSCAGAAAGGAHLTLDRVGPAGSRAGG